MVKYSIIYSKDLTTFAVITACYSYGDNQKCYSVTVCYGDNQKCDS